ncbi:MAG: AsnC family transcriptional regulator [Gammaproteobacteria bacterium]|nr:MAG: AsnC family transcriptional regulator [Gammaproteobacteria bacterium]
MKLDRTDKRLLMAMQKNGRINNLELAELVGLSPSPCSRRIKQLEQAGYIQQHITLLDPGKLNLKLTAMLFISMDRHTPDRFEAFEQEVARYPEVLECSLITGQSSDYLLKVIVPDMDAYQEFLLGRLTRIKGVSGVHSSFVLRTIIDHKALPMDHLD